MKLDVARIALIFCASIVCDASSAKEPITHSVKWLLFEVIEDGVVSDKRIALDIFATRDSNGATRAELDMAVLTIYHTSKRIALDPYHCSTEQACIRGLQIDQDAVSFEMIPFPLAPDRPIRVIATRKGKDSKYQVSAVGLWANMFTKVPIRTEWRQVLSIELPYSKISR